MRQNAGGLDGCTACITTTVKAERVACACRKPHPIQTMEVLGNDQGTRDLREGRGDGCLR